MKTRKFGALRCTWKTKVATRARWCRTCCC